VKEEIYAYVERERERESVGSINYDDISSADIT
jgi:hypothetical protein